jgi:hypothetical protein
MHTIRLLVSVLVFCGIVAAADSNTAASMNLSGQKSMGDTAKAPSGDLQISVPAVKPAPEAPAAIKAPLDVAWYGMAMLRIREDLVTNFKKDGSRNYRKIDTVQANATLSQRFAYKLGGKFKPNKELLLQFELGNDWFATEEVPGVDGNFYTKREKYFPWFSLAYALWDPGYLHVAAGIIPVKGTALMDLLGVSMFFNKRYQQAAHLSWGILTNFSQTGLRIGAPIMKDDFKLGADFMMAVIQQRSAILGNDTMKINYPAWEMLLEFPMDFLSFNITPQGYIIPYRTYNKDTKHGDFEYGAGVDFGYKINDNFKLRAGFGIAQNSNISSAEKNDSLFIRLGTNSNIGTTIKLGPGKIDFDFNLSSEYNGKDTSVNDLYPFLDIKYGWSVNKNFIIMPRCRLFYIFPKAMYDYKLTTRPELIFTGSF